MGRRTNDVGSTHVLEAIVITTIMVSAVAFVATYDQPVTPEGNARAGLTRAAQDTLAILAETPVDSQFGSDALSAYIAECLNKRCDNLTARLSRLAPAGASYALYVSNGYDTYPVYVMGAPTGEAVAASRSFEPQWSGTFVSTATDMVGVGDALLTYALPVFQSNAVSARGSQLLIKVVGQRSDGSAYVMIGSESTTAAGASDPTAVAASLFFVDDAGVPMAVHNLSGVIASPQELKLRLQESQNGVIPAGVELAFEVPRGWVAQANAGKNDGWTILNNATDKNGSAAGSTVRATLNASIQNGYKDLRLDLSYLGDVLDYYRFDAHLARGALATASILIRGELHTNEPTLATPMLAASIPSPMGRGAPTIWTLGAYVPVNKTQAAQNLSGEIEVTSIEIAEQNGNAIFGGVTPIASMNGEWINGGDSIAWYGSVNLSYESLLNLSFQVSASGTAGPSEARAAFVAPITFDDYEGKLIQRTGRGFLREAVLPANSEYGGFNASTSGSEGFSLQHSVESKAVYRSTPLPGRSSYGSAVIGSVEEALYGSYVLAASHTVPVGGEVIIDANVQSILFALADAGREAGITLRFYPPWAGDDRVPVFEQQNLDQGLLTGDVVQMVVLDVNGDGYPDPVVGTTNGRVVAYHGLTGRRLQGNTFTAPVTQVGQQQLVAKINAMETVTLYGQTYIVVTTDKYSDGVYVLAKNLSVVWRYPLLNADTTAVDARTDFDGDGQPEIVVARTVDRFSSKDTLVYVLKAVLGNPILQPIAPNKAVTEDPDAFYLGPGTATTILSFEKAGPFGATPGLAVPIQTTADPGLRVTANVIPPVYQSGALSTPRAGVQGLNKFGEPTSTLFGAPAAVLSPYDHGGDAIDDLILGGTSGYVVMQNGAVLTQPLYSYLLLGGASIISADTHSSAESYTLANDGYVLLTDDAWLTIWGPDTPAVGGKAISANAKNSYWVVGDANAIYKSVPGLDPPLLSGASMWPSTELELVTPVATKDGAPFSFLLALHDFRDVWFRGDDGWIVGTRCSGVCDLDPIAIVMKTNDRGVSWVVEGADNFSVPPTADLNRIRFTPDGTGWILGDSGTLLRRNVGTSEWQSIPVDTGTTYDLLDFACEPSNFDSCLLVGESGAAFAISNARTSPVFQNLTATRGLPGDRHLHSVGYQQDDRAYIGANNMVLMRVGSANWTTLPLNYVENDARAVNGLGDGSGFIYGGNATNGRIWLLHDYHFQSQAETVSLKDSLPAGAVITDVTLVKSNVSTGLQDVVINVSTYGENWLTMGELISSDMPTDDARDATATAVEWSSGSGRELRFRIVMNTSGDKTVMSPHVRMLKFEVGYTGAAGSPATITLDFADDSKKEAANTSADWNTALGALRQKLVPEYWVRNVSGNVLDIQTGFDVIGGDSRKEVWVATGDMLAENSPDHSIYAGSNLSKFIAADNRVYLLNGLNGHPERYTESLAGEVRNIRVVDADLDGVPDALYATTYDPSAGVSHLYAFHPITLLPLWEVEMDRERATTTEIGKLANGDAAIFTGTQRVTSTSSTGHLWQVNGETAKVAWRVIPDDLGKYTVKAKVDPGWLYGPYVVEVEVEWYEPTVKEGQVTPEEIVRSARFYDHFMVTPPDVVSVPTPVYTARLLMWMRDWG